MEAFPLLYRRVCLEDYPCYADSPARSERPGLQLCEYHFISGVRYGAISGYAAATAYFYLYLRRHSSFSDRLLLRLHHYFYPSAGYSAPAGGAAGLMYGALAEARELSPARVAQRAETERREAEAALRQYQRTCAREAQRMERRLREDLSWGARTLWARGRAAAYRRHFERLYPPKTVADMYPPYSIGWVAAHSLAASPLRYALEPHQYHHHHHDHHHTTSGAGASSPSSSGAPSVLDAGADTATSSSPSSSAAAGLAGGAAEASKFTKAQTDALVSRAMQIRLGKEEGRWQRTGTRFGFYGVFTMLLLWNSGNALFRASMGLGAGVALGAVFSASRLDESLSLV